MHLDGSIAPAARAADDGNTQLKLSSAYLYYPNDAIDAINTSGTGYVKGIRCNNITAPLTLQVTVNGGTMQSLTNLADIGVDTLWIPMNLRFTRSGPPAAVACVSHRAMQPFAERLVNNPALFFPLFILMWASILYLIAFLGGWRTLAVRYAADAAEFVGEKWFMQSGRMRWTARYGNALTIGANPRGLYLGVLFLFRLGHPPLYIPWTDLRLRQDRGLVFRYITIDFLQEPGISLTVSSRLGAKIAEAGMQRIAE